MRQQDMKRTMSQQERDRLVRRVVKREDRYTIWSAGTTATYELCQGMSVIYACNNIAKLEAMLAILVGMPDG